MEVPPIKKLDQEVINRIAAGEVIQRPANALKELIENSLDAKSTNIQIIVKNGGLKLLQIQDNGIGIRKEDFSIVCERFTTSKLREFEDLHKISTYGFRGEALASISHIAHLTITSKTKNDVCAYQASYVDSKLQGAPKPTAGNQGTIITVEDLFYNMTVRKKALRSSAEEYQKVTEVVSKYAVHNADVGFALKKFGENNDIRTPQNSTPVENVKIIYGNSIARELVEFSLENEQLKFKAKGYMTNVNYSTKKMQMLLFINHRLVDCQSLKKSIDQVYATYLPKNSHPFIYLSLELDPNNIDINVHPTKHEVHFLNEEHIVESIASGLETKLLGSNNSRAFFTQAKLPKMFNSEITELLKDSKDSNKYINPKTIVRTDAKEQKLDKFLGVVEKPKKTEQNPTMDVSLTEEEYQNYEKVFVEKTEQFEDMIHLNKTVDEDVIMLGDDKKCSKEDNQITNLEAISKVLTTKKCDNSVVSKITRVETKLTSVLELRKEIDKNCHRALREIIAGHVFVGSATPSHALIQHSTKLYLCNTEMMLTELFYQFIMHNFQNLDSYVFSNRLSIFELAIISLELPETGWTPEDGEKSELANRISQILVDRASMLLDYFSMKIDEAGNICSIPILLDNYMPDPKCLPLYVTRLATEVDWETEKECFESFARETAKFYSHVPTNNQNGKDWKWVIEHVLFPALKDYFLPPKSFVENGAMLEIANLHNLYKVFERC